jgi:hypothetical protein
VGLVQVELPEGGEARGVVVRAEAGPEVFLCVGRETGEPVLEQVAHRGEVRAVDAVQEPEVALGPRSGRAVDAVAVVE